VPPFARHEQMEQDRAPDVLPYVRERPLARSRCARRVALRPAPPSVIDNPVICAVSRGRSGTAGLPRPVVTYFPQISKVISRHSVAPGHRRVTPCAPCTRGRVARRSPAGAAAI
jgi:hypothetical protein